MLFNLPTSKKKIMPAVCVTFFTLPLLPTEKEWWGSVKYLVWKKVPQTRKFE
jgi:hypothetical protein